MGLEVKPPPCLQSVCASAHPSGRSSEGNNPNEMCCRARKSRQCSSQTFPLDLERGKDFCQQRSSRVRGRKVGLSQLGGVGKDTRGWGEQAVRCRVKYCSAQEHEGDNTGIQGVGGPTLLEVSSALDRRAPHSTDQKRAPGQSAGRPAALLPPRAAADRGARPRPENVTQAGGDGRLQTWVCFQTVLSRSFHWLAASSKAHSQRGGSCVTRISEDAQSWGLGHPGRGG